MKVNASQVWQRRQATSTMCVWKEEKKRERCVSTELSSFQVMTETPAFSETKFDCVCQKDGEKVDGESYLRHDSK